jgi:hypothetical protein
MTTALTNGRHVTPLPVQQGTHVSPVTHGIPEAQGFPGVPASQGVPGYPGDQESPWFEDMPSAAEVERVRQRAADAVGVQDAPEIREWKSRTEIEADRDLAAQHREARRQLLAERNAFQITQDREQLQFEQEQFAQGLAFKRAQATRTFASDTARERALQRDQLDAIKAKDTLRRLTSVTSFLAAQYRDRRLALTLALSPAVAGVVAGTVNAQDAWSRLLKVDFTNPVWWVLFFLESLATAPLVGILIYQAGKPGGSAATIRAAFTEMRKEKFAGVKFTLLAISVFINVGPHVVMKEWAGLIWLWIPVAIVLSLSLAPRLLAAFTDRILVAKGEAELSAPAGLLAPEPAKLVRMMRAVVDAENNGTLPVPDDEATAGAGAIRKTIAARFGRCGTPDAQATRDALRVFRESDLV